MTAKEFVKQYYPTARAERQVKGGKVVGMQEVYYLIRMAGATMYFSEGKSESNAWVNAKTKILKSNTVL